MVQKIAWWWLVRVETCRYNSTIKCCAWMKFEYSLKIKNTTGWLQLERFAIADDKAQHTSARGERSTPLSSGIIYLPVSLLIVWSTVELHLSERWLSGLSIIWIGLALRVNLSRILKTNLPWNYRWSDQVQDSVMVSITSNQAWSRGIVAGTYCKYYRSKFKLPM